MILSDQQELQGFLSSLHEARALSITLTENRSPRKGPVDRRAGGELFWLEFSTIAKAQHGRKERSSDSPNKVVASYVHRSGENWSCVDPPSYVQDFLRVLQEEQSHEGEANTSCKKLQAVTLQGCGRIPDFYSQLITILSQNAASLESLSILDWDDFITSNLPDDEVIQDLSSRLHHFHIDLLAPSLDIDTNVTSIAQALSHMPHLQTLQIEMRGLPDLDCVFWQFMSNALTCLPRLQELQWISPSLPLRRLQGEYDDHLMSLCVAIGSMPVLQTLELSWLGRLQQKYLAAMFLEHCSPPTLTSLSVHHADKSCADVLSKYLAHNETLRTLKITFGEDCSSSSVVLVMEPALRHPRITSLSLFGVEMDNDVSKTLQMACVYNTTLTDLQVSTRGMETCYLEDIFLGLKFNTALQDFVLRNADARATNTLFARMDEYACSTLCDLLNTNTTLRRLSLQVELPTAECALRIARATRMNATLKSLSGLYYLHSNGTLPDDPTMFSFARP